MHDLRRLIGSPNALFTFEAAARLRNFTRAAEELGVTQAAVSAAVKALEIQVGATLFARGHRQVRLTQAGEQFYKDVSLGLGHIARSAEALGAARAGHEVAFSTSTAFASHWIIPRLPAFRAAHPGIDLRIQTSDRDTEITAERITLAVRRGPADYVPPPGFEAEVLADERLFPVCSPAYLRATGPLTSLADLAERKLIHLEELYRPRPTWREFLAHFAIPFREAGESLRLNDYGLVVQAAVGSQGIALGWAHIVAYSLRAGLLVPALPRVWATGNRFYLISRARQALAADAVLVRDWLIAEARREADIGLVEAA